MYVLVNTFNEWDASSGTYTVRIGAVYGPFDSREEALSERDAMNFPYPEQVFARALSTP